MNSTNISPLVAPTENTASMTPMLQQYHEVKKQYPGALLLFRLGDFYELFFEDAVMAAKALTITLTRRAQKGEDVPMCGIPFHASEAYIARLINQGFKVAICEQMETPEEAKKRGHKAIVRRDVIRVITPGTLTEDALLEGRHNNFLLAMKEQKNAIGIACVDISTGEFILQSVPLPMLESALYRLDPKEILVSQNLLKHPDLYEVFKVYKNKITPQPDVRFDLKNGQKRLETFFDTKALEVFGNFTDLEIMAGGAILEYVELTQKSSFPRLQAPQKMHQHSFLHIDAATRRNLELECTQMGERSGSLLSTIDKTLTAAGGRLLARSLAFPFIDKAKIDHRLNQVEWFLERPFLRDSLKDLLKKMPDGERILTRLSMGRSGPRDLGAIRTMLEIASKIREILLPFQDKMDGRLSEHPTLLAKLSNALGESLPVLAREGNFVAPGYMQELDALRDLKDGSQQTMAALQTRYIQETGIGSLKIKYNNILGYYIDITSIHKDRVPDTFFHRQTLINSMRFSTAELSELQEKVNSAAEKVLALELTIFEDLVRDIQQQQQDLMQMCQTLATVDLILSFATLAQEYNYKKPRILEREILLIKGGRHPVVEQFLKRQNEEFIANDCDLNSENYLWLLTGPNMAGKSTYLRQNALIVILAQMGCYVPADEAHIGIVDKVFSRVGASDDLARGRSTFMVEMVETGTILNQATSKSLVILDEIGRGTSTYDGLSLAWATMEYLHEKQKCRTLFATHYHELTVLAESLKHLSCYTIKIKEWEDKVIFMHTIIPGCADKSYGIHVAELAGLPKAVIARAKSVLAALEDSKDFQKKSVNIHAMPLFDHIEPTQKESKLEEKLKTIQVDDLSPKDALNLIYELKDLI